MLSDARFGREYAEYPARDRAEPFRACIDGLQESEAGADQVCPCCVFDVFLFNTPARRRSHADAWNTTAKIIATFDPKLRTEDNPSQYLMDFVHEDYYAPPEMGNSIFPPFEAHNVWQREHIIRKQFQVLVCFFL